MSGMYIGIESRFYARKAILRYLENGLVQAQFTEGALWETHSWLTFEADDWVINEDTSQVQD